MPSGKAIKKATKKRIKKEAPGIWASDITLTKAGLAKKYGIHRITLWRIEKDDPEFAEAMEQARQKRDDARNEKVESVFYNRLLDNQASPTEYIFYLCNRLPHRWHHRNTLIKNTNIVQNKNDNSQGQNFDDSDQELREKMRGYLQRELRSEAED